MPFVHLPERGVNQYFCTNPTWHYSTSLSTAPITGVLDPNKPNLLLIHAPGSSSAAQQRQFHDERLKSTFNMIALDASFSGWTTGAKRDGDYPIEEVAEDFICAIDKLYAPQRISFSVLAEGYLGSACASWMVHKRPDQVQAIVLASPGWLSETPENIAQIDEWAKLCMSNKNGQGDGTGLLPVEALKMINDYYFAGSDRDVERQAIFSSAYQQRYGAGHSAHDFTHLIKWYARKPIPEEVIAGIKVPVMILSGGLDQVSPLAAAEMWRDKLTGVPGGATIQQLPSAPHLLMYAESGVANRMVYRFLTTALKITSPAINRPTSVFTF